MSQANSSLETYINKDGIKVIERFFDLPLDYADPSGEKIRVFARNLIPKNKAKTAEEEEKLPYMLYLQGGPGFEVDLQGSSGSAAEMHERGYQTLWLDQRGTGLSTTLAADTLPSRLISDQDKANYFKHFRADNIVRDAPTPKKFARSFLDTRQIRKTKSGLKEVFLTGGLAPLDESPDRVYEALIPILKKRNDVYYQKYPQDIRRVRDIVKYLEDNEITLPNGGRLSVSRFLQLGINFGGTGGIDRIHQLVFRITNDLELFGKISSKTLQVVECKYSFDGNPIYAILHEPIYCQGNAPKWSAARVIAKHPQFLWAHVKGLADTEPIYFSGEMVFPDAFDDFVNLRPLKGVAELLANDSSWGKLYDIEQLRKNEVKVSAATYYNDMYVQFDLAQETAATIKNTEQYITNMLNHDGLRVDSKDVMKRLFQLSKREYD